MVKKLIIEKAGNIPGREPVKDVFISIHSTGAFDGDFPTGAVFKSDAEDLHDALRASLPQGTFDHLLALMLQSRAATLITSCADFDKMMEAKER
jgi:hypothetical protein